MADFARRVRHDALDILAYFQLYLAVNIISRDDDESCIVCKRAAIRRADANAEYESEIDGL